MFDIVAKKATNSVMKAQPFLFFAFVASLGRGPTQSASSPSPSPSSAFRFNSTLFSVAAIFAQLPSGPSLVAILPLDLVFQSV